MGMSTSHTKSISTLHADLCARFGAVMEEFEVRDALNAVLSAKEASLSGF
jgi:hypothetical protein